MTEPMLCCAVRGCSPAVYCGNCDLFVGLEGLHALDVVAAEKRLRVRVESPPGSMGCPTCGVVALSHGWREVQLIRRAVLRPPGHGGVVEKDLEVFRGGVPGGGVHRVPCGQDETVARPRGLLTTRAAWWAAARQLRREHASILGLARQLGTTCLWLKTASSSIRPLLEVLDADPTRPGSCCEQEWKRSAWTSTSGTTSVRSSGARRS